MDFLGLAMECWLFDATKRKMSDMIKYSVPAVAALVCALGGASPAEANYAVTLDNYGNGGIPTWASTGGTITVHTKINGVWAEVCELSPTYRHANHWCHVSSVFEWDDVDGVWLTTDSSDGFWLDQFSVWEWTGPFTYNVKFTHGVDNNAGWCFSNGAESPSQYCPDGWSWSHFWTF